MLLVECYPHESIEFSRDEIGPLDDLRQLPWHRAGAARCVETRVGIELRVGPYVGQLVIPDRVVLNVREPFRGTVATCLDLSLSGRLTDEQPSPPGAVAVQPWSVVATRFARELARYVSAGVERKYLQQTIVTARPRGRIDVGQTALKLHSRGRTHQLVCVIRPISDETRLNRALILAASRAEQLLARAGASADLRILRNSILALTGISADLAPDFRALHRDLSDQDGRQWRRLAGLAEVLASGVPAMPKTAADEYVRPMSAWLNVERLFEEAVRRVVADRIGDDGSVGQGRGQGVQLMRSNEGDPAPLRKAADPDVVIRTAAATWLLDAKFRRHDNDFQEDELYQLIAHSDAYGAEGAALVSPARGNRPVGVHWVGRSRSGTAYWVVVVDPTSAAGMIDPLNEWLREAVKQR